MDNKYNNISPELLIPLVEQRSVIWDKTSNIYKDKGLKLAAWREICCVLDPKFGTLGKKENKDFAKKISTKWTHIRDAYMRSLKKEKSLRKEEKRSGAAGAKTVRPYVYKKQLSFLLKDNEPRTTQDSCTEINNSISETCSDTAIDHPHVSFIKGVLPSLALFDDDEKLEFQTGILALIKQIKKKRRVYNLYGE